MKSKFHSQPVCYLSDHKWCSLVWFQETLLQEKLWKFLVADSVIGMVISWFQSSFKNKHKTCRPLPMYVNFAKNKNKNWIKSSPLLKLHNNLTSWIEDQRSKTNTNLQMDFLYIKLKNETNKKIQTNQTKKRNNLN